jgi:DNA invertase Pin-like site-specific DNA recombinase
MLHQHTTDQIKRYIPYYRVSTGKQKISGLGLEAQQQAIEAYVFSQPHALLLQSYTEVESGGRSKRPQLQIALDACARMDATLIVAKLDRLARSVAFVSTLLNSDVEFIAADMPHANRFMIHILAAVAEYEAALISDRTKKALAAAKQRGTKLGNPHQQQQAFDRAIALLPAIAAAKANGANTIASIAAAIKEHPTQVYRILSRLQLQRGA